VVVIRRPQPRSAIAGTAARASQNFCEKNRSMKRWNSSSVALMLPSSKAPATPTTMSNWPNADTAAATASLHPSELATELYSAIAVPPAARISATVVSAALAL
jgi:hypothetical protein